MAKPIDMTGQHIGRWHIDSLAYVKGYDKYYNCTCDCGTKKIVLGQNIRHGKSLSCGCERSKRTFAANFVDHTGEKYNRLTCLYWERIDGHIYWICRCDCGNITKVRSNNLLDGEVKSCGCLLKEPTNKVHGMSHTRIHGIWSKMIERCFNPHSDQYKWYGAEGKTVCDEWLGTDGFVRFYEWAKENGYSDELTIERKDVNDGYNPNNCCWIPQSKQSWNTRRSRKIVVDGETLSLPQAAEKYGVKLTNLHSRLKWGWTPEEAVELVSHKWGSHNGNRTINRK